jgi:hypothetical protein
MLPPAPAVPVTLTQTPALHVEPEEHGLQLPQCIASPPPGATQAPSGHCVSPVAQPDIQVPLLHTSVPVHIVVHEPQCIAVDPTQLPPQRSRPGLQTHWFDWQT